MLDVNINVMKKSNKKFKPDFVVDITNAFTLKELNDAFITAKAEASSNDVTINDCPSDAHVIIIMPAKKKPWYKRFWNWITRKK